MSLLEMQGIKKAFNGVEVLHGVDLRIEEGEVHALLGESVVGLGAVHEGIEEVLHVPESDADRVLSFLGNKCIRKHYTNETEKYRLFHLIQFYHAANLEKKCNFAP